MRMTANKLSITVGILIGLMFAGCAGTPESNQMLQEVQTSYQQAEKDQEVLKNAPVALEEAGEAVARAQQAQQSGKRKAVVDHQAYIAQQRIKIAQQTAMLNAAQDGVKRTETERQEMLIRARQAEAAAAERRAEEALSQAQSERMKAEEARQAAEEARKRAEELAKRVNELEAQQTERGLVLTLGDVLFDVDEATLKPGGERAVMELNNFLNEYTERNVLIEGHTDNTGSESYNQNLSQKRANAVRQVLIAQGIAGSRIEAAGLGEQYPKASNNSSAGRQQNRRVEVIISDKSGVIPDRE